MLDLPLLWVEAQKAASRLHSPNHLAEAPVLQTLYLWGSASLQIAAEQLPAASTPRNSRGYLFDKPLARFTEATFTSMHSQHRLQPGLGSGVDGNSLLQAEGLPTEFLGLYVDDLLKAWYPETSCRVSRSSLRSPVATSILLVLLECPHTVKVQHRAGASWRGSKLSVPAKVEPAQYGTVHPITGDVDSLTWRFIATSSKQKANVDFKGYKLKAAPSELHRITPFLTWTGMLPSLRSRRSRCRRLPQHLWGTPLLRETTTHSRLYLRSLPHRRLDERLVLQGFLGKPSRTYQ